MKKILLLTIIIFCAGKSLFGNYSDNSFFRTNTFIKRQILMDGNRISTWIQNDGTLNKNLNGNNNPGMMWPKGTNRFTWYSSGLTIGTSGLRLATASSLGEYAPGTIKHEYGVPYPYTDSTFKHYNVSKGDTYLSNPDWANWGLMVPYGAPYTDVNQNGQYDKQIDTPGVKGASQTIFICMTDGFWQTHSQGTGFSGGTSPINAEKRITAWAYKGCGLDDVQFIKWEIVNKGTSIWERTHFGIVNDPDLGDATDDYIGCDTLLNLGYCYNSDNIDGNGNTPTYGLNPPAVGMMLLKTPFVDSKNRIEELGMSSFIYFTKASSGGIICETRPGQPVEAYNFLKGTKKEGTPFLIPKTLSPTKFVYPGNPDTFMGWSERGTDGQRDLSYVSYCKGYNLEIGVSAPGDRRCIINTGSDNLTISPLDTQRIIMSQMVARGKNNFNAVIKLKRLAGTTKRLFPYIYSEKNPAKPDNPYIPENLIPLGHYIEQNYPNPFNPVTEIKFRLAEETNVNLTVYDITGREISVLLNGEMGEGNYSVKFDGTELSSGIYFYKFKAFGLIQTKKMLLIK